MDFSKYDILKKYFEADPKACLAGVNEVGDYAFDELFFKVIGDYEFFGELWINFIPQVRPSQLLDDTLTICRKITEMAFDYLFTPYRSEAEMTEGFKTIEILIKFMKRYIRLLNQFPLESREVFKGFRKDYGNLSKLVDDLGFVMKNFSFDFPNGTIDYTQFLILFSRLGKISLEEYDENHSKYYFLFATYARNIEKRRDFKLYECKHPDLPLLISIILHNVQCPNSLELYHSSLSSAFINRKNNNLAEQFESTLSWHARTIEPAKEELGLDSECSISYVLDVLEHEHFDEMPKDEHLFDLWLLKGLAILEEALKKSGYRR